MRFTVDGAMEILGTETNPVVFTNDTDDSYGNPADIYTDGQVNDDYRNNIWIIYNSTSDDANNNIDHAIFRYKSSAITANSADPTVTNSYFNNLQYGLELTGVSAPVVQDNEFNNLGKTPLLISLVSYPQTTSGNTMTGSTWKAIGVRQETLVQDVTLPKRDFGGKVGIPYYMSGNYTVGTGAVLTLDPGVIMKFDNGRRLEVEKGLIAEGRNHPDSLVIFTSIHDDFYAGDTNADSTATNSTNGNWYGIHYKGTSLPEESTLDYAVIKDVRTTSANYAGVLADNASPTITNSSIFGNGHGVIVWGSGNPVVNNNDIYNNTEYGVFNRDKTFTIDATNNWWGNDSGPTHSGNAGGTGDAVSDGVNYNPFVGGGATNPVLGDVSLNGTVQSFDASIILRDVALIEAMSSAQQAVADVSGDGNIGAMDASYILQYLVGQIEAFPAELNSKARNDLFAGMEEENIILEIADLKDLGEQTYSVALDLKAVKNLYAFEIEMSFPTQNITIESIQKTDLIANSSFTSNITDEGEIYLAMASSEALAQSGSVVELTFKLNDKYSSSNLHVERFIANETDYTQTAVSNEELGINLPTEFELQQNYPNPFNPSTTIGFNLAESNVKVTMVIYNLLGQKVKTLVNDVYNAGRHRVVWDGTNEAGMQVSTGIYLYRIQAGDMVQSKKLTLIK